MLKVKTRKYNLVGPTLNDNQIIKFTHTKEVEILRDKRNPSFSKEVIRRFSYIANLPSKTGIWPQN